MDDMKRADGFGMDPLDDPLRWEARVASVMVAAGAELARRRQRAGMARVVLDWARPALSAAATVAVLVSAAAVVGQLTRAPAEATPLAAAVLPEAFAAWLVAGYEPTVTELVLATQDMSR